MRFLYVNTLCAKNQFHSYFMSCVVSRVKASYSNNTTIQPFGDVQNNQAAFTHTGFLPVPAPACGFSHTHTDIAGTVGQFVFFSDRRDMCPHINRRYIIGLMYLRRRYRKRAREYWVHPLLTVRYMEGSFYTLFEKLRNHDSKFYNYFRMSIHTFDFLVDRVTNSVLLFFLILAKENSSSKNI